MMADFNSWCVRIGIAALLLYPVIHGNRLIAADSTIPGEVTTPFPTISNLAVEWQIEGDDNLDAMCEVLFRAEGTQAWRKGMPLRRVPAGISQKTAPIVHWTNRLSGSIFDLEPDTNYEIKLNLKDPDGGGAQTKTFARTRKVPTPSADAKVKYLGVGELNEARPGDLVMMADGNYGAVRFNRDGEPGKPIVFRSTTGKAIFTEVGLTDRKWVYLDGLTVNGPVRLNNTEFCAVMQCNIKAQWGIKAYKPGMLNGYIADNIITGIHAWDPAIMGANGDNEGEGIEITGSGNVVCHNRVTGFRDCLSHMEDSGAAPQMCNDWLNNDVDTGLDDGIEADFALSNCRIMRNRITNCFVGISSQPGLGGPNYFIRNVMYNLSYCGLKLHRFSQGDVILHNTVVKAGDGLGNYTSEPFDHALFRNNLFIGGKTPNAKFGGYSPGSGRAVDVQKFGPYCSFDFDAFGTQGTPFEGKFLSSSFIKLPAKQFEVHGVQLSATAMAQFESVAFPFDPSVRFTPPDLRPNPSINSLDAGEPISNINDGYVAQAPDIGAYQAKQPLPVYGPRVPSPQLLPDTK